MISRIWHGYGDPKNTTALEQLWTNEILPSIKNKGLPGFVDMQLLRRDLADEIEYTTILHFESLDGIKQFAGPEYEKAIVPHSLQNLLKR